MGLLKTTEMFASIETFVSSAAGDVVTTSGGGGRLETFAEGIISEARTNQDTRRALSPLEPLISSHPGGNEAKMLHLSI